MVSTTELPTSDQTWVQVHFKVLKYNLSTLKLVISTSTSTPTSNTIT